MWERELLGLYLSAHPLDKYDAYFEEQTIPLGSLQVEHDKRAAIVGGVISTVRQIVTKSGSKMAFVGLEDKSGEGEVVVFPNLYEEIGPKLIQDEVVKISGKISSTDRAGNSLGEPKIIADEIIFVASEELDSYQATGKKMKELKTKTVTTKPKLVESKTTEKYTYQPIDDRALQQKLYVHVKNPDDHDLLRQLKQSLNEYPGTHEIILVLGSDKASAIRLPFKIEPSDALTATIAKLYGADCVALK
jgi:DNA polymerase-3 subunit alpha